MLVGLCISLLASIFMAYGKVFRRRETIEEQSGSTERQLGAALLIAGFSVQIAANVIYES